MDTTQLIITLLLCIISFVVGAIWGASLILPFIAKKISLLILDALKNSIEVDKKDVKKATSSFEEKLKVKMDERANTWK